MRVTAGSLFVATFAVTLWALRVPEPTDFPFSPVVASGTGGEPTGLVAEQTAPRLPAPKPAAEMNTPAQPRICLPEGTKAISVRAAEVSDEIPYGPKPGTRVDVLRLLGGKAPVGPQELVVAGLIVIPHSMWATVDEKSGAAIPQVESVSLAVTDQQAHLLTLADERGRLLIVPAK
jgi:hypothetical protein